MKDAKVEVIPHYCIACGKCKKFKEIDENLKVIRNTGWTHDIYCKKLEETVYGM